jgi:ankyrin repeat protein|eukprot:COSAG02_NODE_77_length_40635_cov_56.355980_1_plen_380_part_00
MPKKKLPLPVPMEPEPEPETARVPKIQITDLVSELVTAGREAALATGPTVNVPAGLALLDAAQNGDIHAAEQLLAAGASPDHEEHGFTPAILAAREGQSQVLELLVERGARIQPENPKVQEDTALTAAVESAGSQERLDAVGRSYAALAEAEGEDEDKAAAAAADKWRKQQNEVVAYLLKQMADPNRIDSSGYSALHYAAESGNNLAARMLLRHDAQPDLRLEHTGQTPLIMAAEAGAKGIVGLLLEKGGVDRDAQDLDGISALMAAAANDDIDVCEMLLKGERGETGASLELRCTNGSTALLIAAQEKATATAKLLVEEGADLTAQRETLCNPLSMAFVHGDSKNGKEPELARFMRVRGATDPRKNKPFKTEGDAETI